jgi:hypothetical protein
MAVLILEMAAMVIQVDYLVLAALVLLLSEMLDKEDIRI